MSFTIKSEAFIVPWWLVLIQGIAAIVIGALLLVSPGATTLILVQFLGLYWFITGILTIVTIFIDSTAWGWKLLVGILGIVAGFVVLQHPLWSTLLVPTVLVIVIGVQGLLLGIFQLVLAFRGGGWGIGVLGILSILIGVFLLSNAVLAGLSLPFALGILLPIGGIIALVQAFRMRSLAT